MEVIVTNADYDGPEQHLSVGDTLEFGRQVGGVGRLGEHRAISRRHGVITANEDGFAVEATGTFAGVVVADNTTPSRLHIPNGVGPIDIPFRSCSIVVEYDGERARLEVEVEGSARADAWAAQWGIDAPPRPADDSPGFVPLTAPADNRDAGRFRKSNGSYYTWFTVLVALCEPSFGVEPGGAPTNQQLARRTGYRVGDIEKKLAAVYRALDVEHEDRPREAAVERALERGIVTPDHLSMLPDE